MGNATSVVLLLISITLNFFSYGIARKVLSEKHIRSAGDLHVYNTISSLISALTLAVVCFFTSSLTLPSVYTVMLGLLYGLSSAMGTIFTMKALQVGPLSYTNVIISCGMVIPALSGAVYFGETVTVWQGIGIVFMIVSFVCSIDSTNESSGTSLQWFLLSFCAFLFSGCVGVLQKAHQSSPQKNELGMFLLVSFGISAMVSLFAGLYQKRIRSVPVSVWDRGQSVEFIALAVISGGGIALCNHINTWLAGVMESIIFYPVVNGASMILATVAGVLFWRERLSGKQWFGLAVGGAAILLLCNVLDNMIL